MPANAARWQRVEPLPDGRALVVRESEERDVEGLLALYESFGPDDRYRRFFSAYHPPRSFFEQWVALRGDDGAALVAEVDGVIVGEAGYRTLPDGDGELAAAIAPEWRGWLGPYLLDALLEVAAGRGIPNVEADVLASNRPMLTVLRWRGDATFDHEDPSAIRVIVSTTGRAPSWPPKAGGRRILVERGGSQWAGTSTVVRRNAHVVACPGPTRRARRCPALHGGECPVARDADLIVVVGGGNDEEARTLVALHRERHPDARLALQPTTAASTPIDGVTTLTARDPAALGAEALALLETAP